MFYLFSFSLPSFRFLNSLLPPVLSLFTVAGRFTLPSFLAAAPIETVIFSLGGFIPGMLLNIVSIKIPIDTLTDGAFSGDALGWAVGLIIVIVILVLVQIWWMWRTGWFRFYACW